MTDGNTTPVTLKDDQAIIHLDHHSLVAFQDWQRLSKEEKDALIWVAHEHKAITKMIIAFKWMGGAGYLLTRIGAFAAIIISIMAVWRTFFGGPN